MVYCVKYPHFNKGYVLRMSICIGRIANLKTFFNFILIWLWVTVGVSRNEHLREIEEAAEEVLSDKQEIVDLDRKQCQNREAIRRALSHLNEKRYCCTACWLVATKQMRNNVGDVG